MIAFRQLVDRFAERVDAAASVEQPAVWGEVFQDGAATGMRISYLHAGMIVHGCPPQAPARLDFGKGGEVIVAGKKLDPGDAAYYAVYRLLDPRRVANLPRAVGLVEEGDGFFQVESPAGGPASHWQPLASAVEAFGTANYQVQYDSNGDELRHMAVWGTATPGGPVTVRIHYA